LTSPTFTLSLVRELRGSPLTVLVAILLLESSGQVPITAQLLKDVTGFGDHTITDSLHALSSPTRQFVVRINGGWRLTAGFQLPLQLNSPDVSMLSTGDVDKFPHREASHRENREYRGFGVSSCSSSNRRDDKFNRILEEQEQEIFEIRAIRDSDAYRANYRQAIKLNIRDPKASELSALPHVTPDFIQAHVDQAKAENHPLGTAIYRIIHQWSPHTLDEKASNKFKIAELTAELTGHEPGCKCTDCTLSRAGLPVCPDCHHVYQNCECQDETSKSTD